MKRFMRGLVDGLLLFVLWAAAGLLVLKSAGWSVRFVPAGVGVVETAVSAPAGDSAPVVTNLVNNAIVLPAAGGDVAAGSVPAGGDVAAHDGETAVSAPAGDAAAGDAAAGLLRIDAGGRVYELSPVMLVDCINAQAAGQRTGPRCPANAAQYAGLLGSGR